MKTRSGSVVFAWMNPRVIKTGGEGGRFKRSSAIFVIVLAECGECRVVMNSALKCYRGNDRKEASQVS